MIIHRLKKNKNSKSIDIVLILQVTNFEDKVVYATGVKDLKDLLNSKSCSDFKSDFLRITNVLDKIKENNFDIKKFWSTDADKFNVFAKYKNTAYKIKNSLK